MRAFEKFRAESFRRGKTSGDYGKHARNVSAGLGHGHTRLEPGQGAVTEVAQLEFAAVPLERSDDCDVLVVKKLKPLRQHADDLSRFSVRGDRAVNYGGGDAKLFSPGALRNQPRL